MKGKWPMKTAFILVFTAVFLFSNFSAEAAAKSKASPKLTIVTQPNTEYKNGDTISFIVTSPDYTGKVEYRVILYNGTTKKTSNLWNTPSTGYYYRSWQPSGNYNFEIHWPVSQMEPGAYSMTVLVRSANSNSSFDSYVDTRAFWVKDEPKLFSINDINASIVAGQNFILPDKVAVVFEDKSIKEEEVQWNSTTVDTSKEGIFNYEGVVKGYNKPVKLILNVTKEIKAPEQPINVYNGLFKNVNYSDPGLFMQNGRQTAATSEKFKQMLSNINNNKDFTTLADIYRQVSTIPNGDGEKFGCTVDEILKRNTLTGCTDYGLVFAALSRAKGIPTVFLQTARIDWIKDLREQNNNSGMIRGHILVEVYIDNQWYLIDSTAGKLYLKYDRNNFSLDDGYYVFAKSLEVFDMGTKDERDNSNRMKDIFKDFDMALYNQPFYTYINLTNLNETHISATFSGEQSQSSNDSFEYVIVGTKEETEALVSKFGLSRWHGYSESSFIMNYDNIKFNNFIYFRIKGTPVPNQIRDMVPEIDSINDSVYRTPYGSGYIIVISGSSKSDAFNIINSMDRL